MTPEQRALRAQWVRDQHIAADEPKFIQELRPKNAFRRFFDPLWAAPSRMIRDKWVRYFRLLAASWKSSLWMLFLIFNHKATLQ